MIILPHAGGMTIRDIQRHLARMPGAGSGRLREAGSDFVDAGRLTVPYVFTV
jgi:hypothetical protein